MSVLKKLTGGRRWLDHRRDLIALYYHLHQSDFAAACELLVFSRRLDPAWFLAEFRQDAETQGFDDSFLCMLSRHFALYAVVVEKTEFRDATAARIATIGTFLDLAANGAWPD